MQTIGLVCCKETLESAFKKFFCVVLFLNIVLHYCNYIRHFFSIIALQKNIFVPIYIPKEIDSCKHTTLLTLGSSLKLLIYERAINKLIPGFLYLNVSILKTKLHY